VATSTARAVAVLTMVLAVAGCGGGGVTALTPSPTPVAPTASTANPGGALTGFLHAASQQDNGQVLSWLATAADSADLNELLKVYSDFGTSGGFFWEVDGLTATGERAIDGTHAVVALSGPIVWCLGKAANDPTATCSQVNGVGGLQNTYAAVSVGGEWKADVDVSASSGIDTNPLASPTATASTPTP
jgi:hypothetical protein